MQGSTFFNNHCCFKKIYLKQTNGFGPCVFFFQMLGSLEFYLDFCEVGNREYCVHGRRTQRGMKYGGKYQSSEVIEGFLEIN